MPVTARIFVSSPGDVLPERHRTEQVIGRLRRRFADAVELETVLWEREPLTAGEHFQENLVDPSETDLVVVILWARLGTPLPADRFLGRITGGQVTGTEWEFEDALGAYREHGRPDLLVYVKTQGVPMTIDDPDDPTLALKLDEKRRVDRFVRAWFRDESEQSFEGSHRMFGDTSEFEDMLERHLTRWLERRIELGAAAAPGAPRPSWRRGSPFRGLEAFDVEHADVFFGRTRARNELREAVAAQAEHGSAFVAVIGPSGSGKSSLARAALIPDLRLPGMVEGVGEARHAILRLRAGDGDPLAALAAALVGQSALPELARDGYDAPELEALAREAPKRVAVPVEQAVKSAAAAAGLTERARALLVLVVDQFEELFTLPLAPAVRQTFVETLAALARSGSVWVVATLRSDFLARFQDTPGLLDLTKPAGIFMLSPPNAEELGQIIARPAMAAGVEYAVDARTGSRLDEVLRRAAGEQPGALPLLEFVLERLWHERGPDRRLSFEAYEQLGTLEGALAQRAEEVVGALPEEVQAALPGVLRALVTAGEDDDAPVTARPVPQSAFPSGSPQRALVEALVAPEARLLVADGDRVRLAHEALLVHWERAATQIASDRRDLRARARLEREAAEWAEAAETDRPGLLLQAGVRLSEAADLVRRRGAELPATVLRFVEASGEAHRERQARELEEEKRRRVEAERQKGQALAAERRAAAELGFARAERNRALAVRVELQSKRPDRERYTAQLRERAGEFEREADAAWQYAHEIAGWLTHETGDGGTPARDATAMFSLEVQAPGSGGGDCLIVHYGTPASPRFILVDGGARAVYETGLRARLHALRERWAPGGSIDLELVLVTHYDHDRVSGILALLSETVDQVAAGEAPPANVRLVWFNNFLALDAKAQDDSGRHRKDDLAALSARLGVRVNEPFDYFVMPSEIGPARVLVGETVRITVLAPEARSLRRWYEQWKRDAWKHGAPRADLLEQTVVTPGDGLDEGVRALSEGFSSPRVELLRAPPETVGIAPPAQADKSPANLASIVALLEFGGCRMLLTGDGRGDHIVTGLAEAGLVTRREPCHVDLLQLPHWGSRRNVSPEFFRLVTADHYVIVANPRHRLPHRETLDMIAAARGDEPYAVHIAEPGADRLVVDLLAPVGY